MIGIRLFFILIIVANFFATSLAAQDSSLICSESFRYAKSTAGAVMIGADATGCFVYETTQGNSPSIQLSKLDRADLHLLWKKTVALPQPESSSKQSFEQVQLIGESIYLFTSGRQNEPATYQVYVTILDAQAQFVSGPTLLHYAEDVWKAGKPQLVVRFSPDRQKLLVLYDSPYERKVQESVSIKVYDTSLDLLWERKLELPYGQDVVQVHNYQIDNSGGVYMMSGQNPVKNNLAWQKPQGHRYVVFYYNFSSNKLREYDVSLKEKQVISVQFMINPKNELVIAGYYSNDYQFAAAGTFLFVLAAEAEGVRTAGMMPFSSEFLKLSLTPRQLEKSGALVDYYLDYLIAREDDTYLLIGEQYSVSENIMMDPMTGRQLIERRYNYDDLMVNCVDNNARILWSARVPKRQFDTSQNEYDSFACAMDGGSLHVFFNDHPENAAKLGHDGSGEAQGWNGSRGAVTAHVEIGSDGRMHRSAFPKKKSNDLLFRPAMAASGMNLPLILGFESSKDFQFCLIP